MSNELELTNSINKIPIKDSYIIQNDNLEIEKKNKKNPSDNENEVNFKAK